MPARASSDRSDTTADTPPLSPSSATRSSVASSNSSLSLGELSSRMSQIRMGSRVAHEPTECVDPQGSSRKFARDSAMYSGAREGDIQEELDADSARSSRPMDRGRSHELHREGPERTSRPRPQMPRQGSYSKRHSSFDTPREVPFPYGYLSQPNVPLPDHPDPGDTRHERPKSVPLQPPDGSSVGKLIERMVNGDQAMSLTNSADSSTNGGSSPPHLLERSSTTSLPLPTSTPYRALPAVSSSPSAQHPVATQAPHAIPPSTLITTGSEHPFPLMSPPRKSSLNPPITRYEPPSSSCSNQSQPPLPESPPFIADEPDMNEVTRSTDSPFLRAPSLQDARPHHSLPPPPKFLSSLSFSSSPVSRPMSLPHHMGTSPPAPSTSNPLPGGSPFPPPEPPTILTPPPPLTDAEARERKPAPYEPFLPRDQPPPDHTYIAVETVPGEYRLIVRLPGFQRDSITLAMRRRRILHVVADNWSDGGGHFERRISFGYDADLASVRAEFDGEILRVIVPRREPPGWFTQSTN